MSNFVVRWSLFEVRGEVKPFFFRRAEHSYFLKKKEQNKSTEQSNINNNIKTRTK